MLRDQREGVLPSSASQFLVPAGEGEFLASREGEGSGQVDGVVGAECMSTSTLGCLEEKGVVDCVTEEAAPDVLQILEGLAELSWGQALAFAHPSQGRGRLDMSDRGGADTVRLSIGTAGLVGSGLVDQELDQRAGIEVEAQRRPSATYSAALLPVPRSLAGLAGRWRGPSGARTVPSAIKAERWGGVFVETIRATGRPCFVTVIASPSSTRSMIELALSFSSRMPTVAFSIVATF